MLTHKRILLLEKYPLNWKLLLYKWLIIRTASQEDDGDALCYCQHTHKCKCSDPDFYTFIESVDRGAIIIGDKENGWGEVHSDSFATWIERNNKLIKKGEELEKESIYHDYFDIDDYFDDEETILNKNLKKNRKNKIN